jgi:hypothetical protein
LIIKVAGVLSVTGIGALFVFHMTRMWLEHRQKIKLNEAKDISSELQQAIQGEFTRLRQENAEVKKRLEALEHKQGTNSAAALTPESMAELMKQMEAEKRRA